MKFSSRLKNKIERHSSQLRNRLISLFYKNYLVIDDKTICDEIFSSKPLVNAEIELTIICVAYKRIEEFKCLAYSLLSQKLMNFKLLVLHDGYDEKMETVFAEIKSQNPNRIDYIFTKERYNDYGHSLRQIGLEQADTEYVLITNDDNYYSPWFTRYVFSEFSKKHNPDIIMFDMVHGHIHPGTKARPPSCYFETYPVRKRIDIGCFICRTEMAKSVGFRDKSFSGDATYFEDLRQIATEKTIKIPAVLLVHN